MKKWLLLVAMLLCLSVCSCIEGEGDGHVSLDPNVAEQVEGVVEGGVGIMTALSPLIPWLAPFAVGGAGILGTYKRMKPKLTTVQAEKDNLAWGGEVLAEILDEIKEKQPDVWAKIGPNIHDAIKYSTTLENVIREFRRLAPKEHRAGVKVT